VGNDRRGAAAGNAEPAKDLPTFTAENFEQLEQRANDVKGARVEGIVDQVFNVDRSDEDVIALQMARRRRQPSGDRRHPRHGCGRGGPSDPGLRMAE
jgi:hypothetical protein